MQMMILGSFVAMVELTNVSFYNIYSSYFMFVYKYLSDIALLFISWNLAVNNGYTSVFR